MKFKIWNLFSISILGFWLSFPVYAQEKPYDFVIKDAFVFDGDSLVPHRQDIAISDNRIVLVGNVERGEAKEVIEAEGLVASPGFIDFHTHSDFNPLVYPHLGNKVLQGVTTEVVGNCGMSAAPVLSFHIAEIKNVWSREGVEIPEKLPWKSFGDYVSEIEVQGLDTNFLSLVGHGNLRSSTIGMSPRPLEPDEVELVKKLLAESMDDGAIGISFGLTYLPGIFANHEELVTLCRDAASKGGICAFHIRSEGKNLIEAIREAIEIGKEAQAHVHISHLKAAGVKNWPKIREAFRLIEEARSQGLRVTADAYPYTASFAELGVILPDKIYQDPNRVNRFKDPKEQPALLEELEKYFRNNPASWDKIRIATVVTPKNSSLAGKTVLEIAQAQKKSPIETLVELLAEEDFRVSAFYFSQSENVLNEVLSKPYVVIGSDSIADGSAMPHPRAYGTFPRMLARCSETGGVFTNPCWSRTLHQMAILPAEILQLKERGKISVGYYADLVLFDPTKVRDGATYENPKTTPSGIEWVFVNGKPAVRKGKYEPVHSGLFLIPGK